jgi:hypothetical protein
MFEKLLMNFIRWLSAANKQEKHSCAIVTRGRPGLALGKCSLRLTRQTLAV